MPQKARKVLLSLCFPVILLALTACPGVLIDYIQVSFFPFDAVVGATATFHCTAPILGSDIDQFVWDFGDGNSATGETVSHQYLIDGDFVVTCSIISGTSVLTFTKTITITGGFGGGPIGSFLYWSESFGGQDWIYRCDISGAIPCASRTLVANAAASDLDTPTDIAIDGNFLYWSNFGTDEILRCNVSGALPCASELVTTALRPGSVDLDGTLLYYERDTFNGSQILRCDISVVPCSSSLVAEEDILKTEFRRFLQAEAGLLSWQAERNIIHACDISVSIPCQAKFTIVDHFTSDATDIRGYYRQGANIIWSNNEPEALAGCNVIGGQVCAFPTIVADTSTSGVNDPERVVWIGTTLYWKQNNSIRRCDVLSGLPCTSFLVLNSSSIGTFLSIGAFDVAP